MLKRIPLNLITRNPDQPRQHFDQRALEELANSIHENGLQQPITVRPIERDGEGHEYQVIMGERRFRAHKLLEADGELFDILCHVRRMDDRDMHINAILENLQRAEVSPLEEAIAYQRMLDEFDFTPETLATKLGISQAWRITYRTKLLGLTDDNRDLLSRGVVSHTQAYHMAGLSPNGQQTFLKLCMAGLASTDKAAAEAADAIVTKEAQAEMPMVAQIPKRASLKSLDERIDKLGTAMQPLFKDGPFKAPKSIDPDEAQRCIEKLKLLRRNIAQIESELTRSATVSAAA
ncbi:ParB/RepB/Spo0J family partition protein [Roseovarius sp. MMSF_3281]|uniref:ParB/RepB/Spo0J family partition protein n=1 Tax=Roseovarius sp. MMSF_3281 TaxID=3046694 RepID=UPI00273F3CC9|nr:ParB/RepB/Spo0J family partition protein [Roseovarius sp. MMSF_3281]